MKRKPTREEMDEALDLAACGGLDPVRPKDHGKYDMNAIVKYAKDNGIPYNKLTREEMERFRIK
ncbi:MAG: hypothetical protein IKC32_06505 [Clostridia bacterium]|nr:hypothetical protein [Clostridia bacterium]